MSTLVASFAALLVGGLLALVTSRRPSLCSALGAASAVAGCALGGLHALRALLGGHVDPLTLPWHVPYGGLSIDTDALSAFFLMPVYLGLVQQGVTLGHAAGATLLLAAGGLCLAGALALVAFARLVGMALLGEPRDESVVPVHEPSRWMLGPMGVSAALSMFAALAPGRVLAAMSGVAREILGSGGASTTAPVGTVAEANAVILVSATCFGVVLAAVIRSRSPAAQGTWSCGYAQPSARMQYTAASFSELLSARILPRSLRPRMATSSPRTLFPRRAALVADLTDPVTRGVYQPLLSRWADRFARLRWMQQGLVHLYLLYILCAIVALLAWASLRSWSAS